MIEVNQRQDYVASEKLRPEIFNQIGRNINKIVDYINTSRIIKEIEILTTDWDNKQFIYNMQGITEHDLPTVWFENVEQAVDCEIEAETVENGIKFTCEIVPDCPVNLSLEVERK